jgi:MoaA/NifB/PqqE/SkfB family radical SAM enzyme
MYKIKDYIGRGIKFANNTLFPQKKKISTLMFYTTSLCDSQCKHCLIWKKRPVAHIPKEMVFSIMKSACISKSTVVGLEGGEFLLHPEAMEILEWFKHNHPKFDLLSNCLKPERLIQAIKAYPPHRVYLSLDGNKETYNYMRGRDGYDKVIQVIEACKDIVPISLMFTLTPYNSFSDMEFVVEIAKKYDIDIRIGVYNNIDFFDTESDAHKSKIEKGFQSMIPENVKHTSENYDFLFLYEEWLNKNLKLKCYSIKDSIVIHPNGDVPICQNLDIKLGNLYENSLDEIFNSKETRKIQKYYTHNCNGCWINFHRKYDIVLLRTLESFIPKKIIELFYGKYQWTSNKNITYKKLFHNLAP